MASTLQLLFVTILSAVAEAHEGHFEKCPSWVGHDKRSGLCSKDLHVGACFARKDGLFPLKVETQCLTRDQFASYVCPKPVPHKCEIHWEATPEQVEEALVEAGNLQLFGHCPRWVGRDKTSGLCDFTVSVGACYALKDSIFPSKIETQCLAKGTYKNYSCPKAVPHKCEFESTTEESPGSLEESVADSIVAGIFDGCPHWVGRDKHSGLCDFSKSFGACYALKDSLFPLKIETQCLSKDSYESYRCPKSVPHKCKLNSMEVEPVQKVVQNAAEGVVSMPFGHCTHWVGRDKTSGLCNFNVHVGACYAFMDAIFPTKVETQCLTKEQYANYTCPKAVPHKCEFKHTAMALPEKAESQAVDALNSQLFGRCPRWVGHSKKSGLCDFTKHVGACYALMDAILPFKIDTQCLTKEQYSSYKCPKTVPHKCEFHSEASATPQEAKEEIMDTMNAEFLGHCPRWVGHDKLSGLCDFQIHEGACYARKDAIFPLKVETQCLTKDQYAAYKCPEVTPHKCKFHNGAESTEPASVLDETNNLRSHCPHWVGHDKISGLCNFNVHVGACFARMDAIFPTKVETQCLTKEQYANYTCPKAVPHKCEFKHQAMVHPEKAESQAADALNPQLFGRCPSWVGHSKKSGLCDFTKHVGACYALMDAILPFKIDTQCLTKEQYSSYKCPKTVPHKCEFHSEASATPEEAEEEIMNTPIAEQEVVQNAAAGAVSMPFGHCAHWVGRDKTSGLCNFNVHVGACYARMDAIFPTKVETQCLTKEQYANYTCPKAVPHKCEFKQQAITLPEKAEGQAVDALRSHCPRWVGRDKRSGLCILTVHKGACYAITDAIFPTKIETQCLLPDQYNAYKCPKSVPHKCEFHDSGSEMQAAVGNKTSSHQEVQFLI